MIFKNILALLFVLLSLAACHSNKNVVADKAVCKPLQVVKTYSPSTLEYTIDSCYLDKKCLHINVSYTGCSSDTFNLQWNGNMMKSMPPQLPMQLVANSTKNCEPKTQQKQLCIDLDTLSRSTQLSSSYFILLKGWPTKINVQ